MTASSWLWGMVARVRAGIVDDPALRAAEDRAVALTGATHPPLSAANRDADKIAAGEFLAQRFDRAYPDADTAMMRGAGFDRNRAYDREREEARWMLIRALDDTWRSGLEFGRWVERAAARAGIA